MDAEQIDDHTLPLLTEPLLAQYAAHMPLGARLRFLDAVRRHFAVPRHVPPSSASSDSEGPPIVTAAAAPLPVPSVPPATVLSRLSATVWWLVALPWRAACGVARVLWRFAALVVTLIFFAVLGAVGGVALHKDLSAYSFQFGNVAVFGSWYVLIGAYALLLAFSLVWMHAIWLYFVLDEPTFVFGDPRAHRQAAAAAAAKKSD